MSEAYSRTFNNGSEFRPKKGYAPFRSYAESQAYARENALVVVLPKKNELFLDYDSDEEKKAGLNLLRLFVRYYGRRLPDKEQTPYNRQSPDEIIKVSWWRSKSGVGWHAKVELPFEISSFERVGLQAIFGSDRAREVFSYLRLLRGEENATIFFETSVDNLQYPAESETINIPQAPWGGVPGQRQIEL